MSASTAQGKSTLLKIIMNELAPDEGTVTLAKDKTIGYLAQHQEIGGATTRIYETVLEGKRDLIAMEEQIRADGSADAVRPGRGSWMRLWKNTISCSTSTGPGTDMPTAARYPAH